MKKLKDVKKRLAEVPAFLTYTFEGRDGLLMVDKIPLSVEITPPSMAFIIESGQVTSLILRYSETYREQVDSVTDGKPLELKEKPEIATQIMNEMRDRIAKSDEEQSKMIGVIVRLGREYLVQKATYGYYDDRQDTSKPYPQDEKFKVEFTDSQEAAKEWNEKYPDDDSKLVIWVDALDDTELVTIGLGLMEALPKVGQVANIPILGDAINPTNAEVEKGVMAAVPATAVASFPRQLRSIAVEDVSESSGKEPRDSGGNE